MNSKKLKVLRVVTITDAFIHIKGQLESYKKDGKNVVLLSASGNLDNLIKKIGLTHEFISIKRSISPIADIFSIILISWQIFRHKPNILHSSTPKAGLICAIAGFIMRVPVRVHTFTGQRWATLDGYKRGLLKWIDRLIVFLNTKVYSDSMSQNEFLINENIVKRSKISTIHKGSLGGIDTKRFSRDSDVEKKDGTTFLFLGRLNKDKGINELVIAFNKLTEKAKSVSLLFVGPFELEQDTFEPEVEKILASNQLIQILGATSEPEKYIKQADVICLPSYREGFGTVIIEAAAMGLPAIGTKIPGLVDSIIDGETGVLVEKESVDNLFEAMLYMHTNKDHALNMGRKAKERAIRDFTFDVIAQKQWEEYEKLLSQRLSRNTYIG